MIPNTTIIKLAPKTDCTGCGACYFVCPKHCIVMKEDSFGILYPYLNPNTCIHCRACQRVCPILLPLTPNTPLKAYASWSNDKEERFTSASGGIGAEAYKLGLQKGFLIVGAVQKEDFSVNMEISDKAEGIKLFKNSKYVFSSLWTLYKQIQENIRQGERILFIGLPCQVAALRRVFKDSDRLLLAEVVCHGTTPTKYLLEHIHNIERHLGQKAYKMSFRDPITYTYTFTFTLYNETGKIIYAKEPTDGDSYQYGYHQAITYRTNCYHCHFAGTKRIADITLSDYKGLGALAPASYDSKNVSCILVNTEGGLEFVSELIKDGRIFADERPLYEPIKGDPQLQHPSLRTKARRDFETYIIKYDGDFEKAMAKVIKRNELRKEIHKTILFRALRSIKHSFVRHHGKL